MPRSSNPLASPAPATSPPPSTPSGSKPLPTASPTVAFQLIIPRTTSATHSRSPPPATQPRSTLSTSSTTYRVVAVAPSYSGSLTLGLTARPSPTSVLKSPGSLKLTTAASTQPSTNSPRGNAAGAGLPSWLRGGRSLLAPSPSNTTPPNSLLNRSNGSTNAVPPPPVSTPSPAKPAVSTNRSPSKPSSPDHDATTC